MLCAKCGVENPREARFCGKCGTAMSAPPVMPAPKTADNFAPGNLSPKKSWLTLPAALALAAVGLVVAGGLVVALVLAGGTTKIKAASPDSTLSGDQNSYGTPALPATENVVQPVEPVAPVSNSDSVYRQKALGNWRVRRFLDNGGYMDMQAAYLPTGLATWSGTVTAQGQTVYIAMTGSWTIKDGYFTVKVVASNIPQLIPSGYTSVNRIVTLTDEEWTYVDSMNGGSETAVRVR